MDIKIKVFPNSPHEKIEHNEKKIHVFIKEAPENNRANVKILDLMKKYFKTDRVQIISGHKHQNKTIRIR